MYYHTSTIIQLVYMYLWLICIEMINKCEKKDTHTQATLSPFIPLIKNNIYHCDAFVL